MGMTLEQMAMLEPSDEQVWRQAQRDYEGGVPVGEVCARYGLARSSVYQRAQLWRAAGGASLNPSDPPPKAADLAQTAWRRLGQAVEAGRIQEALCWRKLLETLESRAAKEAWAERIKGMSQDEAVDELLVECKRTIAADKARRAASLDTPPPAADKAADTADTAADDQDDDDGDDGEAQPVYDAEAVRSWRAWAVVSDRLGELGMLPAPQSDGNGPRARASSLTVEAQASAIGDGP